MSERRGLQPLLVAVGLLVTVACMYFAVRGVALDEAVDALRGSDLLWLVPTVPVFAFAVGLRAVRWWSLFEHSQRPPLRSISYALLIGYFFNNILPARAGEAARVIALHRRAGTPKAEAAGTVVIERLFDVLALLIILFACYPWLPEITWLRAAAIFGAVIVMVLLALVFVVVRHEERAVRLVLSPLRRVKREGVAERLEAAAANARRGLVALRSPRIALRAMVLTIASWAMLGASYAILTNAFALDVPLVAGMLVTVAINLSLVLPSSPAALGVFEAATVIALRAFDVPHAEALSYALVLHLLNLVPFLVIGGALLGPGALRSRR
ncbi:MAG TPA: lysylphosphatidylglycerol synthase transmembrane domain-containing protein [Solirubrobacteraceae bacterium]|nr:lysylphosphatidylglycerol synthase transmembrane domain-containing protein [Solirubrobacteraceae bacterium]